MTIVQRGSTFHLRKRVPRRYRPVEPRDTVWISLHTDSETVAKRKAPITWDPLIEAWEAQLAGDTQDAERRFASARDLAAARGFRYLAADRVAKLPLDELLSRVEAVPVRKGKPNHVEAAAVLGGTAPPEITVSRALELY